MNNNRRVRLSLLLSILFHILVGAVLWFKPDLFSSFSHLPQKKMQLDFVDAEKLLQDLKSRPPNPLNGQIVDQSEKALNDEVPEDSKFLSRHNQKVVRESQAALHGKFKNTDQSAGEAQRAVTPGKVAKAEMPDTPKKPANPEPAAKPNPERTKDQSKQLAKELAKEKTVEDSPEKAVDTDPTAESLANELQDADGGTIVRRGAKPKFKDLVPSFIPAPPLEVDSNNVAQGGGEGASATDDHLKDIAVGSQTLLSTREFIYFSYYNRIKDKLRQYWEPKIKEKITHILLQGRHLASNSDHTTRIVIVLDKMGSLQHVQVMSGSGVEDLDDAAVEAFRAAAPFPNPPKGIIDPDGTVKINWDFVIEA